MNYLIWIPCLMFSIFFMSWISCKSDNEWKWFWILFLVGAVLQFWPWVARYTKNIVFDALVYDSVSVIMWTVSLMFWSKTPVTYHQILGAFLVLIGLMLFQK